MLDRFGEHPSNLEILEENGRAHDLALFRCSLQQAQEQVQTKPSKESEKIHLLRNSLSQPAAKHGSQATVLNKTEKTKLST